MRRHTDIKQSGSKERLQTVRVHTDRQLQTADISLTDCGHKNYNRQTEDQHSADRHTANSRETDRRQRGNRQHIW